MTTEMHVLGAIYIGSVLMSVALGALVICRGNYGYGTRLETIPISPIMGMALWGFVVCPVINTLLVVGVLAAWVILDRRDTKHTRLT